MELQINYLGGISSLSFVMSMMYYYLRVETKKY